MTFDVIMNLCVMYITLFTVEKFSMGKHKFNLSIGNQHRIFVVENSTHIKR